MRQAILSAILFAALGATALADTGVARQDDQLRAEPSPTAAAVGAVAANTRLEVLERKGFWARVRAAGATGWLKLSSFSVERRAADGASTVSTLASLATGRTGTGNIVSAAGTRGLSAGEIRAARPDYGALAEVKKLAVPAAQAESYAAAGGLAPRTIAYLPAPGAGKP
jgi:hypothetical protein